MTPQKQDRLAGLLFASLIGDSLALGAHWIYDQEKLLAHFGRVTELLAPQADSYHPTKKRGEQTHYGDQALTLLRSINAKNGYDFSKFAVAWQAIWPTYADYRDHATKETLEKLAAGIPPEKAASESEELGGASRIAPLLVQIAEKSVEEAVAAARSQTGLTHGSAIAGDAAEWLTRVVFKLLDGAELETALAASASGNYQILHLADLRQQVSRVRSLSLLEAAKKLGLACPAPQALPTLLMLLDRCGGNLEAALIENVMVGGDQAARALALGMILGARYGVAAIPQRWSSQLVAAPELEKFLENQPGD